MATTQEMNLTIPSMSCNHCVQTITKTLVGVPGVEAVDVNLSTKTVHLSYNSDAFQLGEAKSLLAEEGYPVGPLPFAGRGKPLTLR